MNVAGAIHTAGARPLSDFSWGEILVTILNSSLPVDLHVTVDTKGNEIVAMLEGLPRREKDLIMKIIVVTIDEDGDVVLHENWKDSVHVDNQTVALIVFCGILVMASSVMAWNHFNTEAAQQSSDVMKTFLTVVGDVIKTLITQ